MRKFSIVQRSMRAPGFTLLELMIVLVIMAILVASAVAAYTFAVVKSRRSAAASCLMESAQAMERRYTTCLAYNSAPNTATPPVCVASGNTPPTCGNINQISAFYRLAQFTGPTLAARSFTLTIVPQGVQATKDTKCGTLGINQQGNKTETGTASSASECF